MRSTKRSTDEIIVLALCGLCMMGLALFTFIRFQRGDMVIALLDFSGFLAAAGLFLYVIITQNLKVAGPTLSIISLAGTVTLIAIGGVEERYLLYPTTVVAFFLMRPLWALTASITSLVAVSVFLLPKLEIFVYGKFLLSLSGCFLFAYIFARERNAQRDELLKLSSRDPLTGIGNRRAFNEQMDELIRMQERSPTAVSLLVLDIDNFKSVNDTRGHDAGDRVLIKLADTVSARMRAGDHAYRFGGDEFAVLALGHGVTILAEDLCKRIKEVAIQEALPISVSIGVAELDPPEDADTWIKRADSALYEAKAKGKNRVAMATEANGLTQIESGHA